MITIDTLYFDRLFQRIIDYIPRLIFGILIFVIALYLAGVIARLVKRWLEQRAIDPELTVLLSRMTYWAILILGTVQALAQVNFDVGGFLTGLGILGFTIGFAMQDIAKNFVAGILLLLQQPFDIGHAIEVNGCGGKVLDIQVRSTTIQTWDGRTVIIPNADVYTSTITNFTASPQRRIQLDLGVAYNSDLDQVTTVLAEALKSFDWIIQDEPAPAIYFDNFGDSAINLSIYFWIDTQATNFLVAKDQALKAVKSALHQANIEIPYPIRTMLMPKS